MAKTRKAKAAEAAEAAEPKAAANGQGAARNVRYREASDLAIGLIEMAKELPLPLNVAMRAARMREASQRANDVYQAEVAKLQRTYLKNKQRKPLDRMDLERDLAKAGDETFVCPGAIAFTEIDGALDRKAAIEKVEREEAEPANLGVIMAGLLPVLDGAPE